MNYRPTHTEVDHYRANGYLLLNRPILPPDRFDSLKAQVLAKFDEAAAAAASKGRHSPQLIDCPHWQDRAIFDWLVADEMLDLVEPLIGPDIGIFASHLLQKPPGLGKRVPWHEDSAYWQQVFRPMEIASVTIAIEPSVTANGCLRVIAGSHVNGYSDYEWLSEAQRQEQIFPTEIKKSQVDESRAVDLNLAPNEASIHHVRIIHGSNPNMGMSRRTVLTVRYFPTHARFDRANHFGDKPFHIFLARGRDKAGNDYSEPGKIDGALSGVSTA